MHFALILGAVLPAVCGAWRCDLVDDAAIPKATLAKAFDSLWEEVDHHYSYFSLKKDVDWKALKKRYRTRAVECEGVEDFVRVLAEMLGHLKDIHVWIKTSDGMTPTFTSSAESNWNDLAITELLDSPKECGAFATVAKIRDDGFGCLIIEKQSSATEDVVRDTVAAIQELAEAPGFLVDLRRASGGDEHLAGEVARAFCESDRVYAKSKYRSGDGHNDFGPAYQRVLKSSAKPFRKPVVCIIGPGCVSSGEAFVQMMKCLPQVTTVGAHTRGASGNPKPFQLPGLDVEVCFSRWVDMMPDGSVFEGSGIRPDVTVDRPAEAYKKDDPTLQKALAILREKVTNIKP